MWRTCCWRAPRCGRGNWRCAPPSAPAAPAWSGNCSRRARILALMGGALGFALGSWGVRVLLLLAPGNIPRLTDPDGLHAAIPPLDWRVAVFTMAVALGTAIVFGLLPALHTSNPDLASTLKDAGGRSGSQPGQNRARSVLVVAEVALALVLLIGASLLIRTFVGLRSVNPGIDAHNVLTLETSLGGRYTAHGQGRQFRHAGSPPRRGAAGRGGRRRRPSCCRSRAAIDLPFTIAGKPQPEGQQYNGDEQWRSVSPHYFQVIPDPALARPRLPRDATPAIPRASWSSTRPWRRSTGRRRTRSGR